MSNFLTPVKNTNVTYDKFIFSLFKCCGSTNSNLYKHLLRDDHRELREKADANKLTEQNNKRIKRPRVDSPLASITNDLKITSFVTPRKKYNINDFRQLEW